MKKNPPTNISIIIIGYNNIKQLKQLLVSINQQNHKIKNKIECIYVDDGSNDGSWRFFQNFSLKFKKGGEKLIKNSGRVVATQRGIDLATGEWFLFIRSNLFFNPSAIHEFSQSIKIKKGLAFMGRVQYTSKDLVFQKYLNSNKRGAKKYNHLNTIHYKNLLFGNSIIHFSVFLKHRLNKNLKKYGGEEIDLAEQIELLSKNKIYYCKTAKAVRHNHPGFNIHLKRLFVFGEFNLGCLSTNNQKLICGPAYYLKNFSSLNVFWRLLLLFSKKTYTCGLLSSNYYIIRLGLISSLMLGFSKFIKAQNYQNSNHP